MPARGQRVGKVARAAAHPQRRRLGIPACRVLDERVEILDELWSQAAIASAIAAANRDGFKQLDPAIHRDRATARLTPSSSAITARTDAPHTPRSRPRLVA